MKGWGKDSRFYWLPHTWPLSKSLSLRKEARRCYEERGIQAERTCWLEHLTLYRKAGAVGPPCVTRHASDGLRKYVLVAYNFKITLAPLPGATLSPAQAPLTTSPLGLSPCPIFPSQSFMNSTLAKLFPFVPPESLWNRRHHTILVYYQQITQFRGMESITLNPSTILC